MERGALERRGGDKRDRPICCVTIDYRPESLCGSIGRGEEQVQRLLRSKHYGTQGCLSARDSSEEAKEEAKEEERMRNADSGG